MQGYGKSSVHHPERAQCVERGHSKTEKRIRTIRSILALAFSAAALCVDSLKLGISALLPRQSSLEHYEPFEDRTPFMVVTTIYFLQAAISGTILCVLAYRKTDGAQLQTVRFRTSMKAVLFISLLGLLLYTYMWRERHCGLVVIQADGGPFFVVRNLFWLVSTPIQWYAFASACTTASAREIKHVVSPCIIMQFFGLCNLYAAGCAWAFTSWWVSAYFFIEMFVYAHALPVLPHFNRIGAVILRMDLLLWALYPVVFGLRYMAWVQPWTEQVLLYSLLDIATKTVSFSATVTTQFAVILANISEALSIISAAEHVRQMNPNRGP
eukprot:TRINITY_DN2317_c0_g1_i1.p1 TRINITY_DN2317_c0_g1~~TRINITY_DN2317_c0_g1_i1.p1  ORF type:complete len:325 (+),score=32.86 TRINITY_DN2317_c0_g1_i1:108-1082(+)